MATEGGPFDSGDPFKITRVYNILVHSVYIVTEKTTISFNVLVIWFSRVFGFNRALNA